MNNMEKINSFNLSEDQEIEVAQPQIQEDLETSLEKIGQEMETNPDYSPEENPKIEEVRDSIAEIQAEYIFKTPTNREQNLSILQTECSNVENISNDLKNAFLNLESFNCHVAK